MLNSLGLLGIIVSYILGVYFIFAGFPVLAFILVHASFIGFIIWAGKQGE